MKCNVRSKSDVGSFTCDTKGTFMIKNDGGGLELINGGTMVHRQLWKDLEQIVFVLREQSISAGRMEN